MDRKWRLVIDHDENKHVAQLKETNFRRVADMTFGRGDTQKEAVFNAVYEHLIFKPGDTKAILNALFERIEID